MTETVKYMHTKSSIPSYKSIYFTFYFKCRMFQCNDILTLITTSIKHVYHLIEESTLHFILNVMFSNAIDILTLMTTSIQNKQTSKLRNRE